MEYDNNFVSHYCCFFCLETARFGKAHKESLSSYRQAFRKRRAAKKLAEEQPESESKETRCSKKMRYHSTLRNVFADPKHQQIIVENAEMDKEERE